MNKVLDWLLIRVSVPPSDVDDDRRFPMKIIARLTLIINLPALLQQTTRQSERGAGSDIKGKSFATITITTIVPNISKDDGQQRRPPRHVKVFLSRSIWLNKRHYLRLHSKPRGVCYGVPHCTVLLDRERLTADKMPCLDSKSSWHRAMTVQRIDSYTRSLLLLLNMVIDIDLVQCRWIARSICAQVQWSSDVKSELGISLHWING